MPARSSVRPVVAAALLVAFAAAFAVAASAARAGAQAGTPASAPPGASDDAPASSPTDSVPAAEGAARVRRPSDPGWQIIPFAGYGAHSPLRWGATPDRSHRMLGVQFARPFARTGAVTYSYAPNVVPVFVLTNNPNGAWMPPGATDEDGNPTATLGCEADRCASVYGAAVVPLGFRADVRAGRALTLYAAAGMGVVRFGRTVPVQQARRTNVTFEGGGGVLVRLPAGRALQLGYKYHHLSNAYTAARNPGVDGDVLYAGLAWTVRGRAEGR